MNAAIVLASGSGVRLGGEIPKQFLDLGGKAVFLHSLERFARHPLIHHLVLVCHPEWLDRASALVAARAAELTNRTAELSAQCLGGGLGARSGGGAGASAVGIGAGIDFNPDPGPSANVDPGAGLGSGPGLAEKMAAARIVPGGATRMESGWNGLSALPEGVRYVLIHDAARPFPRAEVITALLDAARECGAAIPAMPCADTMVEIEPAPAALESAQQSPDWARQTLELAQQSPDLPRQARDLPRQALEYIHSIPARSRLRRVQTPQAFDLRLLREAFEAARAEGIGNPTDDAGLIHRLGLPVACIQGAEETFKITTRQDYERAQSLLKTIAF